MCASEFRFIKQLIKLITEWNEYWRILVAWLTARVMVGV